MLPYAILTIENDNDRIFIESIYVNNRQLMYSIIKKMIRNDLDTEDILNETVIRLIKHINTIKNLNVASLRKYIVSTTKSTTLNYLNKRKVKSKYEFVPPDNTLDNLPMNEDQDSEEVLVQLSEIQRLKEALKRLPQFEYEILFMREYDGLTDSEIAGILGKKENSIRSYASRAYRHAREILAES